MRLTKLAHCFLGGLESWRSRNSRRALSTTHATLRSSACAIARIACSNFGRTRAGKGTFFSDSGMVFLGIPKMLSAAHVMVHRLLCTTPLTLYYINAYNVNDIPGPVRVGGPVFETQQPERARRSCRS